MRSGQHSMESNQEEKKFFLANILGEQLLLDWKDTILEHDMLLS